MDEETTESEISRWIDPDIFDHEILEDLKRIAQETESIQEQRHFLGTHFGGQVSVIITFDGRPDDVEKNGSE